MVGSSERQSVQQCVLDELELLALFLEKKQQIGSFLARMDEKTALNNELNVKLSHRKFIGYNMPILSLFYGIIVRMYMEVGSKHNKPHIHAEYAGKKIVMSLDGEILQGDFPSKQLQLLKAWMIIHYEDLQANWELLSSGEPIFRIDPLK